MKNLLVLAALASTASAFAYGPGAGFAIPDNDPLGASSLINVATAGTIVSLDSVTMTFDTTHTWVGDLVATFTSISTGKSVHLFSRVGSAVQNGVGSNSHVLGTYTFTNTGASFAAAAAAAAGGLIAPGTFARSSHALGSGSFFNANDYTVFAGDSITGDWQLSISDNAAGDVGSISSWSFLATTSTVPEPASFAILGLGVAAMIRRRKK